MLGTVLCMEEKANTSVSEALCMKALVSSFLRSWKGNSSRPPPTGFPLLTAVLDTVARLPVASALCSSTSTHVM